VCAIAKLMASVPETAFARLIASRNVQSLVSHVPSS
jgi:hypothetical protein